MTRLLTTLCYRLFCGKLPYLVGLVGISVSFALSASPRLITDNRIENLNGFPSIGRGYNLRSNSLQSMCFKSITKTKPTFDLNYDVDEITEEFFSTVPEVGKKRLGAINVQFFVKKYYKPSESAVAKTYQLKNLLVRVEIRSYYYALDETHSTLSQSAKQLLKNEEFVTFFNSCGHHYVRSVGSFSTYLALLQYRMIGDPVLDRAFINRLERGLFNFSGDRKVKDTLNLDAETRGMRVFVQAVGLSKGNMVNLVPIDIRQFRRTVQDTVKLMQDPNSGLIAYMEVVPWVENPELTAFMNRKKSKGGEQFIRLQKLEANSGVITEINRISNLQIEQYHIATMCENILFENYMDQANRSFYDNIVGKRNTAPNITSLTQIIDQKTRSYDMEKTLFYNLSYVTREDVYISLREFIEYFAKQPPIKLFEENKRYLYGEKKGDGAVDCIDKLYQGGLEKIDYRKIPSCVKALKHIKSESFFLGQYCLPKPVRLVFKEDESGLRKRRPIKKGTAAKKRIPKPSQLSEPGAVGKGGRLSTKKRRPKTLDELIEEESGETPSKKPAVVKPPTAEKKGKPTTLQELLKIEE